MAAFVAVSNLLKVFIVDRLCPDHHLGPGCSFFMILLILLHAYLMHTVLFTYFYLVNPLFFSSLCWIWFTFSLSKREAMFQVLDDKLTIIYMFSTVTLPPCYPART